MPFPTPGDLPDPGIKPTAPASPELAGRDLSAAWIKYSRGNGVRNMKRIPCVIL